MITANTWIRDTLIRIDVLKQLPESRQQQINGLYDEFTKLGYIDARTQLGPDQARRMSQKQRDKLSATAVKVFKIEQEIVLLLCSDEQIQANELRKLQEQRAATKQRLEISVRNLEQYCSKQLNSKRWNATKQEYQRLKAELQALEPAS